MRNILVICCAVLACLSPVFGQESWADSCMMRIHFPEPSSTIPVQENSNFNSKIYSSGITPLPLKGDLMTVVNDWKGVRYRYGGMSKQGTDCSGFVTRVLEVVRPEIGLCRTSRDMYLETQRITLNEATAGDLLFFKKSPKSPISHVAIYLGDGYFAHAVHTGVMVSHLGETYHKNTFYAVTRMTEKNFRKVASK